MLVKRALVWTLVTDIQTRAITQEELKIASLMPLVNTLFPGINYYSMSGFHCVLNELVRPVLKKLFPEMLTEESERYSADELVDVSEFLPSRGYEWQDSVAWQKTFLNLLAT